VLERSGAFEARAKQERFIDAAGCCQAAKAVGKPGVAMFVHLKIRGRVQGVFFRESARRQAVALGVRGWVKNLPDGSVEAAAEGSQDSVQAFIQWCHQGPSSARVEEVVVQEQTPGAPLSDFRVLR